MRFIEGVQSSSPSPSPASPMRASGAASPADVEEPLLGHLAEGRIDVRDIATALGITLGELGRWMHLDDHAKAIDGLLRLSDARTQLMVSRYRASAASVLLQIATSKKEPGSDLMRKACVDLLTTSAGTPSKRGGGGTMSANKSDEANASVANAPAPVSEAAVLDALQSLGEQRLGESLDADAKSIHHGDHGEELGEPGSSVVAPAEVPRRAPDAKEVHHGGTTTRKMRWD